MFKHIKVYMMLLAAGSLLTLALSSAAQAENSGGNTTAFGYANGSGSRDVTDSDITIDSDVYNTSGNISNVYGGYTYGDGGDAKNNKVTVLSGKMTQAIGGNVNTASGSAIGNKLTFQGGTSEVKSADKKTAGVMGGRSTNGNAIGNTLVFHAGSASSVNGMIAGGYAPGAGGNANENTLILSGGQQGYQAVGDIIHGGWAGTGAGSGNANNNSVIILDGYYANNIYVGRTSNGDATGNSLTLAGDGITLAGQVFGGGPNSGTGDKYTGNALNVFSSNNTISGNMSNFQHYNFAFPTDGGVSLTYSGSPLNFGAAGTAMMPYVLPGKTLAPGTTATLLQASNAFTGTLSLINGQAQQGIARMYDYTMDKTADTITATITGVGANPATGTLTQGQAAAFAPVSMGADLVAATGMENARAAANAATGSNAGSQGGSGLVPFMALTGSSMHHNVGAGVNINGGAVMAGLGKKWSLSAADVLVGAFFDASMSKYKANKDVGSTGSMEGTGDVTTVGGGLLARVDVTDTAARGLYAEASVRIGSLYNKYKNEDLRDMAGNTADYDLASTYYSAHAGLGYIWAISQTANLDLYAKYFWSGQSGSSVDIAGDPFTFDPINSSRVRLGGRFSFGLSEQLSPYIGAAWECEMDGVARATTYGFETPTASTQGSTGMGELGLSFKPAADPQLSVDLGVQGFIGMREGVSGNVMIKYEF